MLELLLSIRYHTYGDSGQLVSRTVDGDGEGSVYAVRYDMGNISLGYVRTETSIKKVLMLQKAQEQDILV